ncbi:MAG TPA: MFS transporter [Candidatus Angelobacter sp.]|jgi:MFS family permease|nr:MFS transporter [Candidatus Angelobacter sp.]
MTTETLQRPTYGGLVHVPGVPALLGSSLVSRVANRLWEVGLVLYVLQRFHSASLAGLTVFLSIAPGLALSPVTGALLDRYGRRMLIILDNLVASGAMLALGLLGLTGALSSGLLLIIVSAASFTFPLSVSGTRSLFPIVIPRPLWDLGNAVDSGSDAIAAVIGPALSGALVALVGGPSTLLFTAGLFAAAAVAMFNVPMPSSARGGQGSREPLLRAAWAGVRYVVRNRSLRALAVVMSIGNLGFGQLYVILPVLVLQRYRGGPGTVGVLWGVMGVATVLSGVVVGRLGSEGRERLMLALGFALLPVGLVAIALPWWAAVIAGLVVCGLAIGPIDIALFSLRQRRTDPAWFGRAFAVSMALNFAGVPIGSGIAGPLVSVSTTLALGVAAGLGAMAAVLCVTVPRAA